MKVNTLLKAGSLFFNVAQDDKIRELVKIAHNGAKRRGLFDGWQQTPAQPQKQSRIPFSPPYQQGPWFRR